MARVNKDKWTLKVIERHIENGRLLYEQLSQESVKDIEEDIEGSARKAAIQAKDEAWDRANELFFKIADLEERYEQSKKEGSILADEDKDDFREGTAERYAKKRSF